ncbi:aldehyde dehydrogenase family protein [Oryzomicrobium sp.]|uniref:aldehyde dehydrogenase family protein n=1 Tax=Oryzomicrobium sp. TaxID=1911578 RepID=UPI0025D60CEE|nr:aldehyde dehydrogenase family protein [Oryzomicrobium sp.]MCE1244719.1 aldehyde dehydrogenase family protein [Oryzomicrobium sp.]
MSVHSLPAAANAPDDAPGRHDFPALTAALAGLRRGFAADPAPGAARRREHLAALADALGRHGDALAEAIDRDFGGRSARETELLELFPSLEGIAYARRHLAAWMRPRRRRVGMWFWPARAQVRHQPLGVVGVMVPWNYPLFLAVGPLAAALAAGNRVLIKCSEHTPAFAACFAELIAATFAPDHVRVVREGEGDDPLAFAQAFARLPFDHLLFTGSTAVGRRVMAAAAANLTPVTLELGGKSPVLIAPGADLALAAARIVFAKLANAGQSCVAPDYVLLPRGQEAAFIAHARAAAQRLYGDAASPDYAAIALNAHRRRLHGWAEAAEAAGAVRHPLLPEAPAADGRLAPAIFTGVPDEAALMREEIFGPYLPLVPYERHEDALAYINRRDRPLALYLFDPDPLRVRATLDATASGGVGVNDCLLHVGVHDLPFGGVGPSGMGRYHGPEGFAAFSQVRAVLRQGRWSPASLLHPPFGAAGGAWRDRLQRLILRLMLGRPPRP